MEKKTFLVADPESEFTEGESKKTTKIPLASSLRAGSWFTQLSTIFLEIRNLLTISSQQNSMTYYIQNIQQFCWNKKLPSKPLLLRGGVRNNRNKQHTNTVPALGPNPQFPASAASNEDMAISGSSKSKSGTSATTENS